MRSGHFLKNCYTGPANGNAYKLVQRVPPFMYSIFNVRYKTGRDYRVPPLNLFRHCATFFRKSFCRQRVPLQVFRNFADLPFLLFRHYETVLKFSFFVFFSTIFSKIFSYIFKCLPSIFLILCNKLDFQKVERVPPFTILKTLRFLSLRYSADLDVVPVLFTFLFVTF